MKLFIVGGGSGLGMTLVRAALQEGHDVGYSTSSDQDLFQKEGGNRLCLTSCDLRDAKHLNRLIEGIRGFAPDRLILCPVRTQFQPLSRVTLAAVFEDMAFNVSSIVSLATAYVQANPKGSLTFLLSHICFLYNPGFTLYKTAKDALDSFSRSLEIEYPSLKVLRVYPGAMKTNFAANTHYEGLRVFSPKDPRVWADRILKKEQGCLMEGKDLPFLLVRLLPFWLQKWIFLQLFQLLQRFRP